MNGSNRSPAALTRAEEDLERLVRIFEVVVRSLREKLYMERYISPGAMEAVKRGVAAGLKLGGEKREVVVLFSDIRGFTALSESLPAEQVVRVLNTYLNLQAQAIYERGGVVDKFVGDEVMALFTGPDAERRAALAAQEIRNFVASLNAFRRQAEQPELWVGVALHGGTGIMGNVGSERQMDYTVIGDAVNTAARLCELAGSGRVLASASIVSRLDAGARLKPLGLIELRGKKKAVEVFELLDLPGIARRWMRRPIDIAAQCRIVDAGEHHPVRVRNISEGGCAIDGPLPLVGGARLTIDIPHPSLAPDTKISAVVRHLRKLDGHYRAGLSFEALPEPSRLRLAEWIYHVDQRFSRN